MGTTARVKVWAPDSLTCLRSIDAVFAAFDSVDREMSTYRADSQLSVLNREGGSRWVALGEPLRYVLAASIEFHEFSDGAFDPTIFPLMRLWGSRSGTPRIPADDEISEILKVTGLRHLRLDPERGRARFAKSGVSIDLGGIAKGYALDRGKMAARRAGAAAGLLNLGGNLIVFGDQAGGQVGIQHPLDREKIVARISLRDRSVATSGGYENYFTIGGARYSHIIDPRTGHPADALASVTVVAEEGTAADALATACVVLGREACFRLIRERDQTEVAIVWFEGESLRIDVSEGLTLLDP